MEENTKKRTCQQGIKAFVIDWVIVGVIVAVVALGATVVSIAVSNYQFKHRYDATAKCAEGLEFHFSKNYNTVLGNITMSAGNLYFGYFQSSGPAWTNYELQLKPVDRPRFDYLCKSFTVMGNNDYDGCYWLAQNKYSQAFDVKVLRFSNQSKKTVLELDFGIR